MQQKFYATERKTIHKNYSLVFNYKNEMFFSGVRGQVQSTIVLIFCWEMWSASLEKVPPYSGKQDCNNKTPQSHKEAANCSVLVLHFILGAPQYACSLQLRKDQEVSCVSKHIKTLHKVLTLMQRTFYFDNLGGIFSTQGMNVHSL